MFTDREPATAELYASPSTQAQLAATDESKPPQRGSILVIVIGGVLLLFGYVCANVFAISDLYYLPLGKHGEFVPSPFAGTFATPMLQWLFYGLAVAAVVAGCVLIGSQNFNPFAVVCFIMCPLMALAFVLGMPLRRAGRFAVPAATAYLAVGACLAGAGILRLVNLYGRPNVEFEPIVASLLTEVGLAMLVGAILKVSQSGALSPTTVPAAGDYVAAR